MPDRNLDTLDTWSDEYGQDRRNTRWAILVAIAVHAVFFCLQLPETDAAVHEPAERPIILLKEARFEPPPPREQQTIPEQRALRVPIPDPTPDDPEPLVPTEEVTIAVDLRDTDLVLGLPSEPPPEPPSGLLRVGGDVLPPVRRWAPPPQYTEIARKARREGTVTLEAVIDANGKVERVRVIKKLGLGLDEAAVNAVTTWRFEPATYNGKPVPVIYVLTVIYRLS